MFGMLTMLGSLGVGGKAHAAEPLPKPTIDLPAAKPGETRVAIFAGGCFWCTEGAFDQFKGVKDVESGYTGDTKENATYEKVCAHVTKHAEAIKITYDPNVITYGQLLQIFFLAHDPTTLDRQGNDVGHQYRSAVFYQSEEERKVVESYIKQVNESKAYPKPVVTTLEKFTEFYPAEAYHQDFVTLNPNQGYVRACALPKMAKVREAYHGWLKGSEEKK